MLERRRRRIRSQLCAILCAALFGALTFFYCDQIWQSSQHYPTGYLVSKSIASNHDEHKENGAIWPWFVHDAAGFFTFWLVLVGTAQVFLFWWQLYLIRAGLVDTKEAADAADRSAQAAIRQARVAEDTLAKRERPYLFVYGARYIKKNEEYGTYYTEFHMANHGTMPAVIDAAFFDIMPGEIRPPDPQEIGGWHSLKRIGVLGAGERRERITLNIRHSLIRGDSDGAIITTDTDGSENVYPIPTFNVAANNNVFLRVIIKYSGPFSKGYITENTWIYDPSMAEFTQWGDDRYNYRT